MFGASITGGFSLHCSFDSRWQVRIVYWTRHLILKALHDLNIPHPLTHTHTRTYILATYCVSIFPAELRTHSDCFPKQHQQVCNEDTLCYMRGRNCIYTPCFLVKSGFKFCYYNTFKSQNSVQMREFFPLLCTPTYQFPSPYLLHLPKL